MSGKGVLRFLGAAVFVGIHVLATGCASQRVRSEFIDPIESAHGYDAWCNKSAIRFDIDLHFGMNPPVQARFVAETNGSRVRAELSDGTVLVFDGERAWVSPASSDFEQARFHLLTWPWFLASPFKLSGEGVVVETIDPLPLWGVEHPAARVTFEAGVGDMPDDWYVIYKDPSNDRVVCEAYIVTYGSDAATAGQDPHAVTFDEFMTVDGVTLPTKWQFWSWDSEQGAHGDYLGIARIVNVAFVEPAPGAFDRPPDAREDPLP